MPEESGDYQSLRDVFQKQAQERKLIGLRAKDSQAIDEATTVQEARKAAMEAKAVLSVKFGAPLADKIAVTLLGPIALPEEAFTKDRLPSEEMATEVAKMQHLIAHSIYGSTQEGADPSLILAVGEMLRLTSAIRAKDPEQFRLFSAQSNGIMSHYAAMKLFSDNEAENGTTFKVYMPNYGDDSNEVHKWDIKSETDLVVVASRGDRRAAITMDVKSSSYTRGSMLTVLDPSMNQRRLHRLDPDLRNFLLEEGRGNVSFATTNIASRELSQFVPVEVPRKGITMNDISRMQQSIRNFATLPQQDARGIISTASKL